MIKITYTVTEARTRYVQPERGELRELAQQSVPPGAKIVAIELCVCDHCGRGHSLSDKEFICEACNSR